MRKHALLFTLTFVGLAAFAMLAGWAFFATSGGWRSLAPIWPFVLGGVVFTGALAGVLMWLAFYSASHGYDDRGDHEGP